MTKRNDWLKLLAALMLGLAPMAGCENEVERDLPGGGEIEYEEDETEVETPSGTEYEIEQEG